MPTIISILGVVLGLALGGFLLFGVIWLLVKGFGLLGRFIVHVATFIGAMIADSLRLVGSILLAIVFVPLVILNIFVGRWSATSHFGRAIGSEFRAAGLSIYRLAIGHPARLLGLSSLTEGLERRLPQVIAEAPGRDKPKGGRATRLFDGYTIVGSLAGGGSGGKLYIAEPEPTKLAGFERQGFINVDKVVIKTFSLDDGSRLPQIIRESRALDAAKKMGLVLEHDMSESRFFYVMRYVPGDSLTSVTQRLHAEGGPGGLSDRALMETVGFATDLVEMLDRYHQGGLWHKDVKPDNIIVDDVSAGDGRRHAHLVDFGLVTPLRSAMTLTTHGTEYFRDPELVRQALRGAKVHQIDGGKFDVYAAGAVLFSVIENSFPAHGSLSKITNGEIKLEISRQSRACRRFGVKTLFT
ncbi:MAG: serine/threonine-protein kinase, partial [Planctomycetota bacterium]